MTLHNQYLKVGQVTKNKLFGVSSSRKQRTVVSPISMLISERGKFKSGRIAVIVFGLFTLAVGIILSSIPWLDYIILKNLRLWNGTLSYAFWQRPGVLRLTKVYIFNVTNTESFLATGEKPKLMEVGPYVYREDMEKVNIRFHDNGTVTYQHKKILEFVPELSADPKLKITVPNIPLLTLTTLTNSLHSRFLKLGVSVFLRGLGVQPFVDVTPDQLVFGYDDPLITLAHRFFPKHRRPNKQMGLLIGRNGTLDEVSTIFTGHTDMKDFGLLNRLNGLDHLPFWDSPPCNDIRASEGSLFPPRDITHSDLVYLYDKDICRVLPLQFQYMTKQDGIRVGYYRPPDNVFDSPKSQPSNLCFCSNNPEEECPKNGLQNISPCHFHAPVYLSFPHFYKADPDLLQEFQGLSPDPTKHETYVKIQPKLGVPLEARVKVQLNLKVDHAPYIHSVSTFPSIIFPIMWLDEGVSEMTPNITKWVYLATTFVDIASPIVNFGSIVLGLIILVSVFVRSYKNIVFTKENIEKGKDRFRRGSNFLVNGQHRLLIIRDSYTLLGNMSTDVDTEPLSTEMVEVGT